MLCSVIAALWGSGIPYTSNLASQSILSYLGGHDIGGLLDIRSLILPGLMPSFCAMACSCPLNIFVFLSLFVPLMDSIECFTNISAVTRSQTWIVMALYLSFRHVNSSWDLKGQYLLPNKVTDSISVIVLTKMTVVFLVAVVFAFFPNACLAVSKEKLMTAAKNILANIRSRIPTSHS